MWNNYYQVVIHDSVEVSGPTTKGRVGLQVFIVAIATRSS